MSRSGQLLVIQVSWGDVRVVTTEADVERVLCLSNMLFSAHPAFDQIVKLFVFVVAEALVQNTLPVTVLVEVIRI